MRRWIAPALAAGMMAGAQAHACVTSARLDLNDIKFANLVVVGRISNYKIVLDPVARQERQEWLNHPSSQKMPPDMRSSLANQSGFLSDYARFDVLVDEILVGNAPKRLSVTWDNSTFGEPKEMSAGPFLIGLRDPSSPLPPLRGPSGFIQQIADTDSPTVLQAPCAPALIFESATDEARTIREILGTRQK